jgi:hydroxyacylglutathione hydrolase
MTLIKPCNDLNNINAIYVEAIEAFNDNYIWAIRSQSTMSIALVDPGDAQVCINYIE